MTSQRRDRLIYKGEEYGIATEPLQPYLLKHNVKFISSDTSCWRGYVGSWMVEDNKLYLIDLEANICTDRKISFRTYTKVGLDYLFHDQEKVFANWFSGVIRIPHGKMMRYVHQGYASLYEKELYLRFESGVFVSYREEDNSYLYNYNDKKKMEEKCMDNLWKAIFGVKPKKKKLK